MSFCLTAIAMAPEAQAADGISGLVGDSLPLLAAALAGAVVAGVVLVLWFRRRDALSTAVLDAVPRPRQLVAANGKVIYANAAVRSFFGEARRPLPDLLAAESDGDEEALESIKRIQANAMNGIPGQTEVQVRHAVNTTNGTDKLGGPEWRFVAAYPIDRRPGSVYWAVDDITPRRQMEQVIRDEQAGFVDLLEHAPIGFYSVAEDGRFLFANRTLQEWLGVSQEALESGKVRLHDVLAEALPEGTPPYDPFGAAGGEIATHGEVMLNCGDGGVFKASINQDLVVGENGDGLRSRSVVRDLSRERAMVEALERSEERFGRFFHEAPVGIALIDPSGRVTECNDAFHRLLGDDERKVRGAPLLERIDSESQAKVLQALEQRDGPVDSSGARAPLEVRLSGDPPIDCSMYVTGVAGADGTPSGIVAHFIDTSEQKSLEAQFAQSQKMQAVGQLAGGIAHDFNNLLTAMIGFSDLLLLRHRPGDQSFADIMQIKQNANRAANLVRQLLAFSRQQTLQSKRLSVTDILAELSHLLRRLIGETIELKMVHGRDLGLVKADQGQLEQVIINLVVNARDAMEDGGELRIRTENVAIAEGDAETRAIMPAGHYILIELVDSGCGIATEHLDRIFDPFFSTKEVGAGTGLGLSTVYGIVKQSGGYVFVDSAPGKGTTFSIYLPRVSEAEVAAAAEEAASETNKKRDLTGVGTLLLVEDEEGVRAFSARALRNKGYSVLEANSGEAALELLKTQKDTIDLLVTDVVMPKVDGPTLVREVREKRPDLKVIFISGYTEDAFRKKLDEDSDIHFLQKPFSLNQLAGMVKEVLDA